MIKHPFIKECN